MNQQTAAYRYLCLIKHPAFFIPWFTLIVLSYFFWDQPVAWYFHALSYATMLSVASVLTNFGQGYIYLCVFVVLYLYARFIAKEPLLKDEALYVLLSIFIAGLVCDALKILLGRSRPQELFAHHLYGFYFLQTHASMWSFPSGHAVVVSSFAMAMSILLPRLSWLFAIIVLVICLTRVVLTAHFVSDTLAGMYLGALVALLLFERMRLWLPNTLGAVVSA
jgi:membrane-associated phospholipid phosphatase